MVTPFLGSSHNPIITTFMKASISKVSGEGILWGRPRGLVDE